MDAMVKPWHDDSGGAESKARSGRTMNDTRIGAPAVSHPRRLALIDAARGVAVIAMVIYHFSWDLRYFGYIAVDVETELGWRIFARTIAGTFLFLVGVSLVLSTRRGLKLRAFLKRLAVVVAGAAAITVVTCFVDRDTFIFFGILHHIAVASVLGLAFLRLPIWLVVAAAIACLAAPSLLAGPTFDSPALIWLGLESALPRTNDFVPLLPWFGVVLAGIAAVRLWPLYEAYRLPLQHLGDRIPHQLLWLGRHSLVIYLLHQPVLFGCVYLASQIAPPAPIEFRPWFLDACRSQCVGSEQDGNTCQAICECLAPKVEAAGLSSAILLGGMSVQQSERYSDLIDACRASAGGG
jgi:uncharacterized membrane protein